MVLALPQMQAAVMEWRAGWLGPDRTLQQVEENFQEIHDQWARKLREGTPPAGPPGDEDGLPGERLRFHQVKPASRQWLLGMLATAGAEEREKG